MIYKSEFPVLLFEKIKYSYVDSNGAGYIFKIMGCPEGAWPDGTSNDPSIDYRDGYSYPVMASSIKCINDKMLDSRIASATGTKYQKLHYMTEGMDFAFIRLEPGKWICLTRSAFSALFKYTGKTMDELPIFMSLAEPVSSDGKFTVMKSAFDASKSITFETKYAKLLYPEIADKNCIYTRSYCHYRTPEWIKKYIRSLYDLLQQNGFYPSDFLDIMLIKGKFGIYSRYDVIAYIGMDGKIPRIVVCKNINAGSLDDKEKIIVEPDLEPTEILEPEEYINLDKKCIPAPADIIDVDTDNGFFNNINDTDEENLIDE